MEKTNSSSLSRLWAHNTDHDCGAITAFRKFEGCDVEKPYSNSDNSKRNKSLVANLIAKGYGVTRLEGKYPEGGSTVKEISFFVVDLNDQHQLENDLTELGHKFEQDSILFVPKGTMNGEAEAYLVGTNNCPNNFLAGGGRMTFDTVKHGVESEIYTSFVNGKPFYFTGASNTDLSRYANGMGMLFAHSIAGKDWKDLEEGEQEVRVTYSPTGMTLLTKDNDMISIHFNDSSVSEQDTKNIRIVLDRILEEEIKSGVFGNDIPHPISEEELNSFKRVAEFQGDNDDSTVRYLFVNKEAKIASYNYGQRLEVPTSLSDDQIKEILENDGIQFKFYKAVDGNFTNPLLGKVTRYVRSTN